MKKVNKIEAGKYVVTVCGSTIAVIEKISEKRWRVFDSVGKYDFKTLAEAKKYIKSWGTDDIN